MFPIIIFMNRIVLGLILIMTAGCALRRDPMKDIRDDRRKIEETLEGEVSLKADREKLAELRKEIPEDKQKSNDELALFLNLMGQGTEPPHIVREKFQALVQKRRSAFREKVQQLRDDYKTEETRRRDEFLKDLKLKRDAFLKRRRDSKANREFFADQEKQRNRFFADERERRRSFESELNAQSKDFDSYMRERTKEFNELFRLYSKKYSEKPKEKKAVTGDVSDFEKLKTIETTPLGTEN